MKYTATPHLIDNELSMKDERRNYQKVYRRRRTGGGREGNEEEKIV